MMRRVFSIVMIGLVLLAAFASGGAQNGPAPAALEEHGLRILELSTDKDVYSAREEVDIFLSIYTPANLSTAEVKVTGVKSSKGVYYVSYSSKTALQAGENTITFTKTLPSCSNCAGIKQGTYFIDAAVTYGNETVMATHSIAITSAANTVIPVNVEVEEVKRWTDNADDEVVVVDLRSAEEYDAGHIKGARSIPLDNLSNQTAALNTSKKIVIYSADGSNSSVAGTLLMEQGFERVYPVIGGLQTWNESGYVMVTRAEETPAAERESELALAIAALMAVAYVIRRRG
ncbi:MAG: rhodanese-like domain-containing protein [Methanomicrobia archaeon]|nr:rhodanese-like domain-containing protein [Methanomicrobia archaeon]